MMPLSPTLAVCATVAAGPLVATIVAPACGRSDWARWGDGPPPPACGYHYDDDDNRTGIGPALVPIAAVVDRRATECLVEI